MTEPNASDPFEAAAKDSRNELFDFIGKRLRRRRRLLDMSQQELGNQVGVRFQQIQKYECGQNKPGLDTLIDLGRVLKVNLDYFLPPNYQSNPQAVKPDVVIHPDLAELVAIYPNLHHKKQEAAKRLIDAVIKLAENNVAPATAPNEPTEP